LRQRRGDIPLLADFFCRRYGRSSGKESIRCSTGALEQLANHPWAGNVRELENTIQRAVALCPGLVIGPEDLCLSPGPSVPEPASSAEASPIAAGTTVREMERQLICRTLENTGGNRTHAARLLGISLRTLRNKLNEFGLQDRPAKFAQSQAEM
jgi:DNA-binding NtrC family response regulator